MSCVGIFGRLGAGRAGGSPSPPTAAPRRREASRQAPAQRFQCAGRQNLSLATPACRWFASRSLDTTASPAAENPRPVTPEPVLRLFNCLLEIFRAIAAPEPQQFVLSGPPPAGARRTPSGSPCIAGAGSLPPSAGSERKADSLVLQPSIRDHAAQAPATPAFHTRGPNQKYRYHVFRFSARARCAPACSGHESCRQELLRRSAPRRWRSALSSTSPSGAKFSPTYTRP